MRSRPREAPAISLLCPAPVHLSPFFSPSRAGGWTGALGEPMTGVARDQMQAGYDARHRERGEAPKERDDLSPHTVRATSPRPSDPLHPAAHLKLETFSAESAPGRPAATPAPAARDGTVPNPCPPGASGFPPGDMGRRATTKPPRWVGLPDHIGHLKHALTLQAHTASQACLTPVSNPPRGE